MKISEEITVCLPNQCDKSTIMEIIKALLSLIPEGKVISYSEISKLLGLSPRAVGRLLSLNDEIVLYPCHRVVRKCGKVGGYKGEKYSPLKEMLLRFEGVVIENEKISKYHYVAAETII